MNAGSKKRSIADRSASAQLRKTKLEAKLLELQLAPNYRRLETIRVITGASGLVLALVTVIGGFVSIGGWLLQRRQEQQTREQVQLDAALSMLADSTANKRLAAVESLRSFLSKRDDTQNLQVMLALAGAIALEDSGPVRRAITFAVEDVDANVISSPVLTRSLQAFDEASRSLVREQQVFEKRPGLHQLADDPTVANLQNIAEAITSLLRKGARAHDMTGIYLAKMQLTGQDLSGINFNNAILAGADFTSADLHGSSFDGADLDGTVFRSADLRLADFTFTQDTEISRVRRSYVEEQMRRPVGDQIQIWMPNFKCADLRGAKFVRHPLIAVVADDIPGLPLISFPSSFKGADVSGADFSNLQAYGVSVVGDDRWPFYTTTAGGWGDAHSKYESRISTIDTDRPLTDQADAFSKSLMEISGSFQGVNWKEAKLPRAIRDWLNSHPPPSHSDGSLEEMMPKCLPRSGHSS